MSSTELHTGSLLKHGEYRIERTLGQGGFGITYEAEQVSLGRKVAVKEFFMKEHCNREESTSRVSVPSEGSKDLVEKFRQKFIREARMIAALDHDHIVKIHDVFEENGTAYYVMEYLGGASLDRKIKDKGAMPESEAISYIRQIASALEYLHSQNILHFDVKPSNVLLCKNGSAKLIDFGISKHYDDAGVQTSSTPVGISKGFAPLEQYQQGANIKSFSPATDIYSLGATLYALLSGGNPPEASIIYEDGLPIIDGVSPNVMRAIEKAMQPRRKDRPQSVEEFLALLDGTTKEDNDEDTVIFDSKSNVKKVENQEHKSKVKKSKTERKKSSESEKPEKQQKQKEVKDSENKPFPKWAFVVSAGIVAILIAVTIPMLLPKVGKITFESEPQGAQVWLDGKDSGKITPCTLASIPFGPHNLTFKLDGYCEYTDSIKIIDRTPICYKGTLESHEWIDLGLSVKWATCNVGASRPEDYGYYFAWGETSPKSSYEWENLKYHNEGDNWDNVKFSKYVIDAKYGSVDNKTTLELGDDAARANWGGNWRMPTRAEQDELREKCNWTWTTLDGKSGYKVTSKSNGNSIFLPAAGFSLGTDIYYAGSDGLYLSSSLDTRVSSYAYYIICNSRNVDWMFNERCHGRSVRPVCP